MSLTNTCFEIVHFAFRSDVPQPQQLESMKQLGIWAKQQLGYLTRQSFYDPHANRWSDVVEWNSAAEAHAAMERSQQDASLAGIMQLLAPEAPHVGHYERLI